MSTDRTHNHGPTGDGMSAATTYISRAAADAERTAYGDSAYWDHLEQSALRHHAYYRAAGNEERAALMLTRTLSDALHGNDGA